MTIPISQQNRPLRATTPLGGDVLVPVSMVGEEEVSRPFVYTVDFISTEGGVSPADLLGKAITLQIRETSDTTRPVHGLVRRFGTAGRNQADQFAMYRVEIVPALWFLSLSTDCRTFEQMSILDIVEKVCKDAGVTNLKRRVTATMSPLPYVVQYRETNLDFVHRLLESAGLYYTFEHADDKHTLVFSDSRGGSIPAGKQATVKMQPRFAAERPQADVVYRLSRDFAVHSKTVSLADHHLLRANDSGNATSSLDGARGEQFDYLGDLGRKDAAVQAKTRIEVEEASHDLFRGSSTCSAFESGTRVTISGGAATDSGTELHLLKVTHRLEVSDLIAGSGLASKYENEFVAMAANTPFRPPQVTPRPFVHGTQTAKIVGAGGTGEIDVDADGCLLIEFPWDRGAGKDGQSKHRVHVASVWSGAAWGFIQIPRVGQEVLVEFLEGDPDRPIITGRVYTSAHKAPYTLPANKTQSGWKSRTLGGGSDNFNEIRFDDKKGEEHVNVQAEKDMMVLVKNDETRKVEHDRTTTIKNNDTRTVSEGNDVHTIEQGDQTLTVKTGKRTTTVKANETLTVQDGNRSTKVEKGNDSLEVSLGNITMKAGAGSVTIEAMQKITLKVGSNSIEVSQTGITMKGLNVKSEATVQAEFKGLMTKVEGTVQLQAKGTMAQVNGDAMLMLKGGVTMIN